MRGIDFCPNYYFSLSISLFIVENPILRQYNSFTGNFSLNYNGG